MANSQGATVTGNRLAAATLQQLQQAGFLKHLPEMLTHAAQGLTAVAARHRSSSSGGSSRGHPTGCDCTVASQQVCQKCKDPFALAAELLSVLVNMSQLWPDIDAGYAAGIPMAPAVVQLQLAALDALGVLLQQHHQQQQQQQQQQPFVGQAVQGPTATAGAAVAAGAAAPPAAAAAAGAAAPPAAAARSAGGAELGLGWPALQGHTMMVAHMLNTRAVSMQVHKLIDGQVSEADRELSDWMCSPQLHRCITLMTCVAVTAVAGRGSSTSSSGTGSTGGSSSGSTSSRGTGSRTVSSSSSDGSSSRRTSRGQNGGSAGMQQQQQQQQQQQGQTRVDQGCSSRSSQAAVGGYNFLDSPLASRMFELLGVDQATVQYMAREVPEKVAHVDLFEMLGLIVNMLLWQKVSCAFVIFVIIL